MGMRHAAALALIAVWCSAAPSAQRPGTRGALELVRAYADAWRGALAAVVAEERYTQTLVEWPGGRFRSVAGRRITERRLVSDVLLMRAPDRDAWLMFRDVFAVDGAPVRDRQHRFDDLFVRPGADVVTSARRIADESARFNLGHFQRNINTPATTLVFLDAAYAESTTWKGPKVTTLDGRQAWELSFEQRRAPFAIRTPEGRPHPASGRIWVEPESGRIVQTELEVRSRDPRSRNRVITSVARLEAWFGPVPGIGPWVPLRMEDSLDARGLIDERITGIAFYSNHRLFQTAVRIITPP